MSEYQFDTSIEEYLDQNHGKLNKFYGLIADGMAPGPAFGISLSRPDIYRIRKADKWTDLRDANEFDNVKILEIIEFLKESAKDYPEDSPLWHLR